MMAFVFYLFIFVCVVMLQPMEDVPVSERNKHKFMVQTMCVDDSLSPETLDEAVSKRERQRERGEVVERYEFTVFLQMRKADKKKLMDSKLKCSFVEGEASDQVCCDMPPCFIVAPPISSHLPPKQTQSLPHLLIAMNMF